jgi:hypothetical protein
MPLAAILFLWTPSMEPNFKEIKELFVSNDLNIFLAPL